MSYMPARLVHFNALRNAINAKLAQVTMSEAEKERAYLRVKMIYVCGEEVEPQIALERIRSHVPPLDGVLETMNEFELFSLYAVAMRELGIEPYLPDEEWQTLQDNPLELAYDIAAADLENAQDYFLATHNISVDLDIEK